MKYSRQRELIENVIMESKLHPTADDVYTILKPENPALSLGTVYRNLNTLSDLGKIRKLAIAYGVTRYDGDITEHYHACCNTCSKVYDIVAEKGNSAYKSLKKLEELANSQIGMKVTSQDIYLNGICKDCQNDRV